MSTKTLPLTKDERQENEIIHRVIRCGLDAGLTIDVSDGVETTLRASTTLTEVFAAMKTTGQDVLYFRDHGRLRGWIQFVYGNAGHEVIADHTLGIEIVITPAIALAESLDLVG